MSKNIFVKISGDLFENKSVIDWVSKKAKSGKVTVCIGGGTQINEALVKAGIPIRKHGPLGREHKSDLERKIADKVLAEKLLSGKIVPPKK